MKCADDWLETQKWNDLNSLPVTPQGKEGSLPVNPAFYRKSVQAFFGIFKYSILCSTDFFYPYIFIIYATKIYTKYAIN